MARLEAELEQARPYLALAREIHEEVTRVAAGGASVERLAEALEAIPKRERAAVARAVFDRLPAADQWAILERVFDDQSLRDALDAARRQLAVRERARTNQRFDTRDVAPHELLTVGLFREADVRAAVERGAASATCARRLVLRAADEDASGSFSVVEDVFNPAGGYFVTAAYDQDTWRDHDRLPAHAVVRPGSISDRGGAGPSFEPVLQLGGRFDLERDGALVAGRLHIGYVMVGDVDVFAGGV